MHPFCLQEEIKEKMIKEATGEDDTERSSMIDSDIDEVEGWAFEYKLQDYSTIKHLSA